MNSQAQVILLVEDNDDHAELVKRHLNAHRIPNRIYHVRDGEEALDYLYQRKQYQDIQKSPRPDLILLDLRLPKVDGLQVLKNIKESSELRVIPTVVLTSSESNSDIGSAYKNYVNSYLVKPFDFKKFSKMMNNLGTYWLGWNANSY
ncbi:response regulator [Syntrophomonas palmitatica]|uniref:response regulator n=1 Tax=Syntrophomonas palmitatica TaxID=402877 RepID=UPI0006D14A8F|nr:response regulator [Syntrophomonas palmitatica]